MSITELRSDPAADLEPASPLPVIEARIEREIARLRRTAGATALGEFQRGGDDLDLTALRQGHEAEQAIRSRCAEALGEWISTLRRIRQEPQSFGTCQSCLGRIERERLELLPTTRTCAGCEVGRATLIRSGESAAARATDRRISA